MAISKVTDLYVSGCGCPKPTFSHFSPGISEGVVSIDTDSEESAEYDAVFLVQLAQETVDFCLLLKRSVKKGRLHGDTYDLIPMRRSKG